MAETVPTLEDLIALHHTPEARRTPSRDGRYLLVVDGRTDVSEHGPTSYETTQIRASIYLVAEKRRVLETTLTRWSSDGEPPCSGGARDWGFSDDCREFWVDTFTGTVQRYPLEDRPRGEGLLARLRRRLGL